MPGALHAVRHGSRESTEHMGSPGKMLRPFAKADFPLPMREKRNLRERARMPFANVFRVANEIEQRQHMPCKRCRGIEVFEREMGRHG